MTNRNGLCKRRIGPLFMMVLAFFLFGCGSASGGPPADGKTAQPVSVTTGNIDQGQNLFMGNAHFRNDGPPCMGCHSVGQNGLLGGGALGPNLTNVSARRSQTEILGILSNTESVISPVMRPIYTDTPLTAQEQADLLAFLEASTGQPESDPELLVIGISLAGFVAAVVLIGVVYRGRLRGVRKSLIKKAQSEQ